MIQRFYKTSDGKEFIDFAKCIEHEFYTNEAINIRYPSGVAIFNKFGSEIELNVVSVFEACIIVIFDWNKAKEFFEPFHVANATDIIPNNTGVFVFDADASTIEWKQSTNPAELFVRLMKKAEVYQ